MEANLDKEVKRLIKLALGQISRRDRSRHELTLYLEKKIKGDSQDNAMLIAKVLEKIEQFNLLNDLEFAQKWAQSKARSQKGPRYIWAQLLKKGIAKNIIEKTIQDISEEEWQHHAAKRLEKYKSKLKGLPEQKKKSKAYQYLSSRGYNSDTIRAVIDVSLT